MSDLSYRIDTLSPEERALLELWLIKKSAAVANEYAIPQREVTGPCPLSFAQQRLWFLSRGRRLRPLSYATS